MQILRKKYGAKNKKTQMEIIRDSGLGLLITRRGSEFFMRTGIRGCDARSQQRT